MDKAHSEFSDLLKKDVDQRIEDLHERVSRQIATQERERGQTARELTSDLKELEKYLSSLVECARREAALMYAAQEKAVAKAEAATEKRFESVNEFRAQLSDQNSTFMPREVADSQLAELRKQLVSNTDRLNKESGKEIGGDRHRTGINYLVTTGLATVAVIATVLVLIFGQLGSSHELTCIPSSAVAKTTLICK